MIDHVAVVGGGYSGALQAINLLRRGVPRVTLIERRSRLGRGAAYSTPHADHLLNVRACGMSAFPDAPDHFADWVSRNGQGDAESFAERRLYGRYIGELLAEAAGEAGDRLRTLNGEAVDIVRDEGREIVRLADGAAVAADAVILAIGNLPPDTPRMIAAAGLPDGVYLADPWAGDIAEGLGEDDSVLLVGTGLTTVDAALILDSAGFRGRILALSRRGLMPRAHVAPSAAAADFDTAPESRCVSLLRRTREEARRIGWRRAVDQLRPVTQQIWAAANPAERRRFLTHLRPWFDVHRHRIAPAIAVRIAAMEAEGRLRPTAGKLVSVSSREGAADVVWRPRGCEAAESLRVRRIVNCTGPQGNIARAGEPLLDALLGAGRIRPDPCRIGIDVDPANRVLDDAGRPSPSLYAVGPMTRGAFWEIVAVPDIRCQVAALAGRLAS